MKLLTYLDIVVHYQMLTGTNHTFGAYTQRKIKIKRAFIYQEIERLYSEYWETSR